MSKRWEPVNEFESVACASGAKCSIMVERDEDRLTVYSDYTPPVSVELPDDLRLCRQVESDAVSVPIGVREAIAVCANYGMPVGVTYWQYNGARDKVIAWLDEQKAGE